jgi:predicted Zn-dependent protease
MQSQSVDSSVLDAAEARSLCERILGATEADGAQVRVEAIDDGNVRFAANRITTSGDVTDVSATVTVRFGARSASATFNQLDTNGIRTAVRRAEDLARLAPEDPEQVPLLGPQGYAPVSAFATHTAELDGPARAGQARAVLDAAGTDLVTAGFLERRLSAFAVANSAGLFGFHRATDASLTTTVRTPSGDGSGWAGSAHNDWQSVTPASELAATAREKARASVGAEAVPPGKYVVVLEPTAVGSLVQLLGAGIDARAASEGRSPFSLPGGGTLLGERVAADLVTIGSDPQDPDLLQPPFTDEGVPVSRTVWIERGVLQNLAFDRYWAGQQGHDPVPFAGGIKMEGGTGTIADLVSGVEHGLLVTRFWYIRGVDPRSMRYTGLTRDGTFLIENGQISRSVKNLRFNQSVLGMLQNIEAIGASTRVVSSETGGIGTAVVVPPAVVRDFEFTAVSDAV